MITREQLMAYADGEADAQLSAAVERALETDAALVAELDALQADADRVRAAFPALPPGEADERLAAMIRSRLEGGETVVDLASRRASRDGARPRHFWPAAIAASLLVGLGAGWLTGQRPAGLVDAQGRAGAQLSAALSDTPSGRLVKVSDEIQLKPVISFRSRDGADCRQFTLQGGASASGVACRHGETWRIRGLASDVPQTAGDGYVVAGGPGSDAVSVMVDGMIDGEPLDQAAETARIRANWTR